MDKDFIMTKGCQLLDRTSARLHRYQRTGTQMLTTMMARGTIDPIWYRVRAPS